MYEKKAGYTHQNLDMKLKGPFFFSNSSDMMSKLTFLHVLLLTHQGYCHRNVFYVCYLYCMFCLINNLAYTTDHFTHTTMFLEQDLPVKIELIRANVTQVGYYSKN